MSSVEERYRGSQVRVFALNRDRVMRELTERARRLVAENPDVVEVRLFGSLARGEAGPGSDADLFAVLERSPLPFLERSAECARWFSGAGIGCDVFVYTLDEVREMRREGRALLEVVDREGILLAHRGSDSQKKKLSET